MRDAGGGRDFYQQGVFGGRIASRRLLGSVKHGVARVAQTMLLSDLRGPMIIHEAKQKCELTYCGTIPLPPAYDTSGPEHDI